MAAFPSDQHVLADKGGVRFRPIWTAQKNASLGNPVEVWFRTGSLGEQNTPTSGNIKGICYSK